MEKKNSQSKKIPDFKSHRAFKTLRRVSPSFSNGKKKTQSFYKNKKNVKVNQEISLFACIKCRK